MSTIFLKIQNVLKLLFNDRFYESIQISGRIFIIYYIISFIIFQFETDKIINYSIMTLLITPVIFSYLYISLSIFFPFTLLGLTFSGEKPLNPLGFLVSVIIFWIIIYLILCLIEFVREKKLIYFRHKSLANKVISIFIYLYIMFLLIWPFFVEIDFF